MCIPKPLHCLVGGVGTIITQIYDHWMKRSQERIDMAKIRRYYIKSCFLLQQISCLQLLEFGPLRMPNENRDYEQMFYYHCNTLYLRHKVIQKFGEIQLDDLEGVGEVLSDKKMESMFLTSR